MMTFTFKDKKQKKNKEETKEEPSLMDESRLDMVSFEQGLGIDFTCPVCRHAFDESNKVVLKSCGHYFCKECVIANFSFLIQKESQVLGLMCPWCSIVVDDVAL